MVAGIFFIFTYEKNIPCHFCFNSAVNFGYIIYSNILVAGPNVFTKKSVIR